MGIFSIANQHIRFAVNWRPPCCTVRCLLGFSLPAGNATLGGTRQRRLLPPVRPLLREVNRIRRYSLSWLLRIIGTFIGCIAGLVIIIAMIRAPLMILVCYRGRFLYLDILAGTNRKLVCVGAGRLYRADHCDHYSAGNHCLRRSLPSNGREIVIGIVCALWRFALSSAIDQTRSGSRAGLAGRAISINATLHQAWRGW